jgi:hypothetical protein
MLRLDKVFQNIAGLDDYLEQDLFKLIEKVWGLSYLRL